MMEYVTPHIRAKAEDFARTVLMPGDPLRSKMIAEKFLTDAILVNDIRGIQGYTGYYQGKRVSVMASGMGCPSMAIYAHELFGIFGVEQIIRVGSTGGFVPQLKLRDLVLAQAACGRFSSVYKEGFAPVADFGLLQAAYQEACARNISCVVGNVLSSDAFYSPDTTENEQWRGLGVLAVEMESAALYSEAAVAGKKALAILTVSDLPFTGEKCSPEERQASFTDMIEIALSLA